MRPGDAGAEPTDRATTDRATTDRVGLFGRPGSAPTVVGVWAHPDDEAYLSAGLMARVARAGGRVVCVTATSGERGTDDPVTWPPERLADLRRSELASSLAAVGVTEHHLLGYGDGHCEKVPTDAGAARVAEILADVRPDVVVTFGPDGMTGHSDHVAVGGWATRAWLSTGHGLLLYATTTRSFADRHRRLHDRFDLFGPGLPVEFPDDETALDLALDAEDLDTKRAALAAHASQTAGLAATLGEDVYRDWWSRESFRSPTAGELSGLRSAA